MKLTELLNINDDFHEYEEEELKQLHKDFPKGIVMQAAFNLMDPNDLSQYNLLTNTRRIEGTTSSWNNSALNVLVQYYRIPPDPSPVKKGDKAEGNHLFKPDAKSQERVDAIVKAEDEKIKLDPDIAPQSNPVGDTLIDSVEQKNDIETATLPEKPKKK